MQNNNSKAIFIALGIIIFLGVMFWLGKPGTGRSPAANTANISGGASAVGENFHDFGTISMKGGKVRYDFKFKNNTAESIVAESLFTSCMCTTASFIQNGKESGPYGMPGHGFVPPLKKIVNPGEEVTIAVVFDPAAHGPAGIGEIRREIFLNSKYGRIAKFAIKANVTP